MSSLDDLTNVERYAYYSIWKTDDSHYNDCYLSERKQNIKSRKMSLEKLLQTWNKIGGSRFC